MPAAIAAELVGDQGTIGAVLVIGEVAASSLAHFPPENAVLLSPAVACTVVPIPQNGPFSGSRCVDEPTHCKNLGEPQDRCVIPVSIMVYGDPSDVPFATKKLACASGIHRPASIGSAFKSGT